MVQKFIMKKKLLIVDYSGHPFQIQLSKQLARNDYLVKHVYCESFTTPKGDITKIDIPNYSIESIHLKAKVDKTNFIKRRKADIEFGELLIKLVKCDKPELIFLSNLPLDSLRIVCKYLVFKKLPYIYWLQDIHSIAIKSVLSKKNPFLGHLIAKYYYYVEKNALSQSNGIVCITDDFIPILKKWKISVAKFVIPNWAPLEELPVITKNNDWSIKHNLTAKKIILYSGTLGYKHNPNLLLKLGRKLKNNQLLIIISEGIIAENIKSNITKEDNIMVLPFQNFKQMPNILGAADLLIGILENAAGIFSVPSKVLTYLTSGKPIVLSVPKENLVSKLITKHSVGFNIEPNCDKEFVDKCIELLNDKTICVKKGQKGREYAEKYFNIINIAKKFEKVIKYALIKSKTNEKSISLWSRWLHRRTSYK